MNDDIASQNIHWPEQEGPKVLSKYCWWEPVRVETEARMEFACIIKFIEVNRPMFAVRKLYDFARIRISLSFRFIYWNNISYKGRLVSVVPVCF